MKLNKNVGKNCYPDSSDVMVVQTALASIKHKTKFGMKPIWDGKIDGKNSKELACAIDHFQCGEHMKMTGKVEAFGPTLNKLKQRIPMSVRNRLSEGVATAASATTGGMQKVKSFADKAVSGLKGAPLPQKEAEALSKIIKDAAGVGVPLFLDKVDITSDGRFEATMGIDKAAYPSGVDANKMKRAFTEKISQFVGKYGAWQKGLSGDLKYKSAKAYSKLTGHHKFDKNFMNYLGLSDLPKCKVLKQCCSALINAGVDNKITNKTIHIKEIVDLVKQLPTQSGDTNAQKLVKLIDNRTDLEKKFGTGLSDTDFKNIEKAINTALPKLTKAINALNTDNDEINSELEMFFNSSEEYVKDIVLKTLSKANAFLETPKSSDFKSKLEAPDSVKAAFERNKRTLAMYSSATGKIYIDKHQIGFSSIPLGDVILHEVLHMYMQNSHRRPNKTDPAYDGEEHFYDLKPAVALDNPDSYVAFINSL